LINKKEIELLLKKGILGLIKNDNTKTFEEDNIENILKNNSNLAKYSLIQGSYTFSKSSFVSNKSDTTIDLNDPNFWKKVFKGSVTGTEALIKNFKEN